MAEVADTVDDDLLENAAWFVVRWLLHHPSEGAIIFLTDFDNRYGPFWHPDEMSEALVRMCVHEMLTGRGPLQLCRFSTIWS
ncbi:hypothetical protein QLQ12_46655 [Actinoplanes sp. NEAU-A12]|uniref:Uncharacterized protein n=1 Tax=Actinoplanes sandaracinus TaxID=3045177 RepID=A0ABT6X252_9ACTN|nr:hypothetical protein [Actinoplanes sandaracinus]MDI6106065.1 hypothetical protein [Actinoplanes sandaracinus]